MRSAGRWVVCLAGILAGIPVAYAGSAAVRRIELSQADGGTNVIVALSQASRYRVFRLEAPERVVVDIDAAHLTASVLPLPSGTGVVHQVRVANRPDGSVRLVVDLTMRADVKSSLRNAGAGGGRLVLDLVGAPASGSTAAMASASSPAPASRKAPDVRTPAAPAGSIAAPTKGRDVVIAVDAGHGGKDPGAHGPRGLLEKDVTLRIARRLAAVINAEPGMRGVLTRDQDEFIPLRGRMERARAAQADLFVSIHADAVRNRSVQGASIYVLNEKGATDEAAKRLAARENAADLIGGVSLGDKDPMLRSVLLDLSQNASLSSSIEVADEILEELTRIGTVRRRQVMQAPFMVLKSPDVPSVLVETAYISNPAEERRLDSDQYRDRLAVAIFAGVRDYFYQNPPRGTLVAELSRPRQSAQSGIAHDRDPGI